MYAALAVIALTAVNISGIRETKGTRTSTVIEVAGVVAVIVTGILLVAPAPAPAALAEAKPFMAGAPLAILFVLFTFGGWNEGAYILAELKERAEHGGRARRLARHRDRALSAGQLAYVRASVSKAGEEPDRWPPTCYGSSSARPASRSSAS